MTVLSDKRNTMSCTDISLLLDKELSALSAEENDAVSRHLSQCSQCNEFMTLFSNLPLFPGELSKDELNFAIHRVQARVQQQKRTPHPQKARRFAFAFAASFALLTLTGVVGLSLFSSKSEDAGLAQCSPTAPSKLVAGVYMTYCDTRRKPETIIEGGGDVRVSLRKGPIGLLIDPNRPNKRKVVVETPQGLVKVKGTVFTVNVGRENTWVEVFRGVVEVISREKEETFNVAAGHGADLVNGNTFRLSAPKTGSLHRRLMALTLEEPLEEGTGPAAISSNQETTDPNGTDELESSNLVTAESHHGINRTTRQPVESMYDLIQQAQSCLIDRNWKCAAARYRTVLTHYSRRPESMAVLISLAKVELRYMNSPKSALTHYKNYQRRAPNGPLAEEAQFGIAEVYQRLGRSHDEKKALRRFIQRFPESSHVKKARSRLKQLGE